MFRLICLTNVCRTFHNIISCTYMVNARGTRVGGVCDNRSVAGRPWRHNWVAAYHRNTAVPPPTPPPVRAIIDTIRGPYHVLLVVVVVAAVAVNRYVPWSSVDEWMNEQSKCPRQPARSVQTWPSLNAVAVNARAVVVSPIKPWPGHCISCGAVLRRRAGLGEVARCIIVVPSPSIVVVVVVVVLCVCLCSFVLSLGGVAAAMADEILVTLSRPSDMPSGLGFSLLSIADCPPVIYDIIENTPAAECAQVTTPTYLPTPRSLPDLPINRPSAISYYQLLEQHFFRYTLVW